MKKKTAFSLIAATGVFASAATVAGVESDVFGTPAATVSKQDFLIDASRSFAKVDVDNSGTIDLEEFAAQAVVYAELARLNRLVTVDGAHEMRIDVPDNVRDTLGYAERTAIDAVARRSFYLHSPDGAPLTPTQWTVARTELFSAANRNNDDTLTGRELKTLARIIAQEPGAVS
jgi:hypothetical protein